MKKCILFLAFITIYTFVQAESPATFALANEQYEAGKYEEAITQYKTLIEEGYDSADLYYNLGNAYFRKNKLPEAVLYFEKAALRSPRDQDIQHNLSIAKDKLPDQFEVIPGFFIGRWWNSLRSIMGPTGWGIMGLLFLWTGIGGLALWLRGGNRKIRKQGFTVGVMLTLLSIIPFSLGFDAAKTIKHSTQGVIMTAEVELKSAPDEVSKAILTLHGGTTISILDEIGSWKKVRLSNGEEGWLENDTFEMI